jgi:hypothetical protein
LNNIFSIKGTLDILLSLYPGQNKIGLTYKQMWMLIPMESESSFRRALKNTLKNRLVEMRKEKTLEFRPGLSKQKKVLRLYYLTEDGLNLAKRLFS